MNPKNKTTLIAHRSERLSLQINLKAFKRIEVKAGMMRHLTEEEEYLMDKLHNDKNLTEEEKEDIRHKLIEIDKREVGDTPFCH